ncbi:MAG: DUF4173 domain-containing protein, partial [Ruminococcus sp.]|nr:DUF4173 domain-containing protein [Ruminococcus sp.]
IVATISLILGFLYIRFALVNTTGFITTVISVLIATVGIVYVKNSGYKISRRNIINLIVIYVFSLVYSITANDFIKFLNSIFLILQTTYTMYRLCDENKKSPRFYYYAQMKALFSYPFANFGKCPKVISNSVFKKGFGKNIKYILIGLLTTAPVTLIVGSLLISADMGMESIFHQLNDWLIDSINISLMFQILFGFLVGCGIFSMMYTNIYKKNFKPYDDITYEIRFNNYRVCPSLGVYSALTPLCILYIMYIVSQIGYFTNAFNGTLYGEYTYSEYARRGFFELTVIVCINLIVISIANISCKRLGNSYHDKKPLVLRVYGIAFSIFTLFIISTAMSKMFLYINEYGLTRLRVYTSWFMILLGLVFIIMVVREFKEFNLSSAYKIMFTIMFGILCFSSVDRVIATTNIWLYENNKIENLDISDLEFLSHDAYPIVIEYEHNQNYYHYDDNYISLEYSILMQSNHNYERYNLTTMEFINTYEKYYN